MSLRTDWMRAYKFIALALYTFFFRTTESKFVVYDVIGRNAPVSGVLARILQYFVMFY